MMNLLFVWIIIGTVIGFLANLIDSPLNQKSIALSIVLGIVGASLGGLVGEVISEGGHNSLVSPMLYIVMGSFLAAMVPSRGNLL